jgi:hypothetical protein
MNADDMPRLVGLVTLTLQDSMMTRGLELQKRNATYVYGPRRAWAVGRGPRRMVNVRVGVSDFKLPGVGCVMAEGGFFRCVRIVWHVERATSHPDRPGETQRY